MKLVLATQNKAKQKEFSDLAKYTNLEFISLPEDTDFPDEIGNSFKANALIKAEYVFALTGMPTMADDSGLEAKDPERHPDRLPTNAACPHHCLCHKLLQRFLWRKSFESEATNALFLHHIYTYIYHVQNSNDT